MKHGASNEDNYCSIRNETSQIMKFFRTDTIDTIFINFQYSGELCDGIIIAGHQISFLFSINKFIWFSLITEFVIHRQKSP